MKYKIFKIIETETRQIKNSSYRLKCMKINYDKRK